MKDSIHQDYYRVVDIETALKMLGFEDTEMDGLGKKYGPVEFRAAPWMGGWEISGHYYFNGVFGQPQFMVAYLVKPVELAATLYGIWQDACPDASVPEELKYGEKYSEIKRNLRILMPASPGLRVDRKFFRFCISFLETHEKLSKKDYEVEFSYDNRQLKLTAGDIFVYCPANGTWIGSLFVASKEFFSRVPRRFNKDSVPVSASPTSMMIQSNEIPARWAEKTDEK